VTAGPTREAIDPVRFISNHSSGKMGVEIARAAWRRGANVTLVAGPIGVDHPVGVALRPVETVEQMAAAVRDGLAGADVLVMAAAPADFRPADVAPSKMKKGSQPEAIALEPTADILTSTRDARNPRAVIVGFALETGNAIPEGRRKLTEKALDLIVVNDATEPGAGFGVDTNRATLVSCTGTEESLPLMSKAALADVILDRIQELRHRKQDA
jgi:phosphopantothenoylcysteine decarboxylase / phosphopantothenate---cysteine ligase